MGLVCGATNPCVPSSLWHLDPPPIHPSIRPHAHPFSQTFFHPHIHPFTQLSLYPSKAHTSLPPPVHPFIQPHALSSTQPPSHSTSHSPLHTFSTFLHKPTFIYSLSSSLSIHLPICPSVYPSVIHLSPLIHSSLYPSSRPPTSFLPPFIHLCVQTLIHFPPSGLPSRSQKGRGLSYSLERHFEFENLYLHYHFICISNRL